MTVAAMNCFCLKQNLLGLYQEYVESLPASISCLRRQMAQSRSFRLFAKVSEKNLSLCVAVFNLQSGMRYTYLCENLCILSVYVNPILCL